MSKKQLTTELETIIQEIAPEEIAPEEIAPEEIAPEEIAPKEITLEEIVSEELLKPTAKLKDVIAAVNALNRKIESLGNNSVKARNRGPKSERVMTDEDAQRIIYGDLMDESHKNAAEILGLSYGQIYSARQGFTFKSVRKEAMLADKSKSNPWIYK
jgi:hypothetical protein